MGVTTMSKRMGAGVLAVAVALASGPAMAWEPDPQGRADHRITVTTVVEIGVAETGAVFAVLA